jgi:hypothetical protein
MLALEDLKTWSEDQIKAHIAKEYGKEDYEREGSDPEVKKALKELSIIIAYESVGSWGCDSSSFFLFKDSHGKLFELHGSHCSCYGFEDQFKLEEATIESLKLRNEQGVFYTGGYDEDSEFNKNAVKNFINGLVVS